MQLIHSVVPFMFQEDIYVCILFMLRNSPREPVWLPLVKQQDKRMGCQTIKIRWSAVRLIISEQRPTFHGVVQNFHNTAELIPTYWESSL